MRRRRNCKKRGRKPFLSELFSQAAAVPAVSRGSVAVGSVGLSLSEACSKYSSICEGAPMLPDRPFLHLLPFNHAVVSLV